MPFKIVQTRERGKTFLSCVPHAWENNKTLLWPKKGSKRLQRNEESLPQDDWISTPCLVKRSDLTYDEAQIELTRMQLESDTEAEDERSLSKRRHINITDLNELALQCVSNQENIPPELQQESTICDVPCQIPTPSEEQTIITSQDSFIMPNEAESFWINPPQKSNFEEIVLQRLDNIDNTHQSILLKLSEVGTQIDKFLRETQEQKLSSNVGFRPIDDIETLEHFNDSLKNKAFVNIFKEKLRLVCGFGKGRGANNCFALVDVMFSRRFLTECSWAGGSRAESKKHCFKAYKQVINFFFEIIHDSDNSFTLLECESFFKNILKNSVRRHSAKMLRASATKIRGKGKGKGKITKSMINQETDAAAQQNPTVSLTYPAQVAGSSQPQTSQSDSFQAMSPNM